MKITIIGTGYVGLVSGACFADLGNDVLCLDLDEKKVAILNAGGIPIYEPGLEQLVRHNAAAGRLRFTTNVEESVAHGAVQFIAVGTPADQDGSADMRHVLSAARNIGRYMNEYRVVVDKSTVPVGTAERVQAVIEEELKRRGSSLSVGVVSNPEFLKEGAAVNDFMRPDRIVVGSTDERATQVMRQLYTPLLRNHDRMLVMDPRSAELTKYAANAMLATRISFMNELANLAEKLGANVEAVRNGIGSDQRIGYHFLYAGVGYGGSCFPKDTQALVRIAQEHGSSCRIVEAVIEVNAAQKARMIKKIREALGGSEAGKTIGVLGLTFKPETDDMRDAPALSILPPLMEKGATIRAHDPQGMAEARHYLPDAVHYCDDMYEVCTGADAVVVLTEWNAYRGMDLARVKRSLKGTVLIDLRNVYERATLEDMGFSYHCIGR